MIEDIVRALRKVVKDQKDLDLIREVHEESRPVMETKLDPNLKNTMDRFKDDLFKNNNLRNLLKVTPEDE